MSHSFTVVIPARYASSRLPGKPLIDLMGKTMIQRVYEQASLSDAVQVVVATDDHRIAANVEDFGGQVCLTRSDHVSGTDRVEEVTRLLGLEDSHCIVNVQGDEPLMPPSAINQVASLMSEKNSAMATLCEPIDTLEDLLDPNIVKVVKSNQGRAIYFSRAPIPWDRDELPARYVGGAFRHLGIYGYTTQLLHQFVSWPESYLERQEKLEQLRILENGESIGIAQSVVEIPPGIDTANDLERTLAILKGSK